MFSPDSSITGIAVTGLTSPTYGLTPVLAPAANARSYAVTSKGGTQTNVDVNSTVSPFTMSLFVPVSAKALPPANAVTGLRGSPPNNQFRFVFRKGGDAASGVPVVAIARVTFDIPAGMETYDVDNLKALVSLMGGVFTEEADDIVDTFVSGTA